MPRRELKRLHWLSRLAARAGTFAVLLGASVAFAQTGASVVSEAQIKAAFLYNFTKFVEWPEQDFPRKGEPIVIAILGDSEVAPDLEAIVSGRRVNGHPIVVKMVLTAEEAADSQLLFVSGAHEALFGGLRDELLDDAVLTVGESEAFAAAGGAIFFLEHEGKLRFEINMTPAETAGLKISAELQKLATAVRRAQ